MNAGFTTAEPAAGGIARGSAVFRHGELNAAVESCNRSARQSLAAQCTSALDLIPLLFLGASTVNPDCSQSTVQGTTTDAPHGGSAAVHTLRARLKGQSRVFSVTVTTAALGVYIQQNEL